jgi:microcystin-dependent protein
MFGGSFAPAGWAFCDGSLQPISENETLFNLIGTTYGGDGQSTFGLPDLRGRVPLHQGSSAGTTYVMGEMAGTETVTLTVPQMPVHSHPMAASQTSGTLINPAGNIPAGSFNVTPFINDVPTANMNAQAITATGGSQPHENRMPFACLNYIISLFGIFPTQT